MSANNSPTGHPGRLVLLIQRLISALAPPLHSLHWKIFLLSLASIFLPGIFFAWKVGQGIERSHLRLTEPGMIDAALLSLALAALVSYALSKYLTGIITGLARRAERVADGEPGVVLETWTKSEFGDLSRAVERMRRKLEGKEYVQEMALTFSHEIKTPLASIRGAAEILEQEDDPEVRKKFLGNIVLEVGRLSAIATNFLALSRIESEPVDPAARASLPDIANSVADVFRARAQAIVFESKMSDVPCWIAMPPDQLRRIIEALLENAFQFTPPGKKVLFTTSGPGFTVRDEGPGIPQDLQPKIFDRFFTTVNPATGRRGTGLGLAIVKSLAARYHARISLDSVAGTGTSVTVHFEEIPPIS